MSQISELDDDLRPEYDFTQLTVVDRGTGRKQSNITPAEWNRIVSNNPSDELIDELPLTVVNSQL